MAFNRFSDSAVDGIVDHQSRNVKNSNSSSLTITISAIAAIVLTLSAVIVICLGRLDLLIALCYALTLGIICCISLKFITKDQESADSLPKIFLVAYGVRVILALGISLFLKKYVTYDVPLYEGFGLQWSDFFHGLEVKPPFIPIPYVQLVSQFVGFQYYVSGNNTFVPDITNAFIGSMIPLIVYHTGRRFFGGELVGRSAAVFATFNAACIIWSVIAVRDIYIVLFIALSLSEVTELIHRFSLIAVLRLLVWLALLNTLRGYAMAIMFAGIAISITVLLFKNRLVRSIISLAFIGTVIIALASGQFGFIYSDLVEAQSEQLIASRSQVGGQAESEPGYLKNVNIDSPLDLVEFMPVALIYFWSGPLLGGFGVRQVIFALPEIFAWYVTFWYGFRGFIYLRGRNKFAIPIIVYFLLCSVLLAVICTNFSEAIRLRSMISVPLQLFAGVGWVRRRNKIKFLFRNTKGLTSSASSATSASPSVIEIQ